jgi:hypothetical protein
MSVLLVGALIEPSASVTGNQVVKLLESSSSIKADSTLVLEAELCRPGARAEFRNYGQAENPSSLPLPSAHAAGVQISSGGRLL